MGWHAVKINQPIKILKIAWLVVFNNDPGDQGSIPSWVIPKTQKMVLDAALLNAHHYKVWIKGKLEESWERNNTLPYISV